MDRSSGQLGGNGKRCRLKMGRYGSPKTAYVRASSDNGSSASPALTAEAPCTPWTYTGTYTVTPNMTAPMSALAILTGVLPVGPRGSAPL